MMTRPLVIGSRSSKLALAQTRLVADGLKKSFPALDIDIRPIKTVGDNILDVALSKIGDKGLFTKELEEALLHRQIDLAVHSTKDLPTALPGGLTLAALTVREDPRDVLVSAEDFTIASLPRGSRVGTSSLRRSAQLLHWRSDVRVLDLRGNLDTRIKKLQARQYDAIILAYAGIKRLGLSLRVSAIPPEEILPQAGQGALGLEVREDADEVIDLVRTLDDADTHRCIDAERSLLAGLEGGCQVPIGTLARIEGTQMHLKAGVFSLDGKKMVRDEISGVASDAPALGHRLADKFLQNKEAREILDEVKRGLR